MSALVDYVNGFVTSIEGWAQGIEKWKKDVEEAFNSLKQDGVKTAEELKQTQQKIEGAFNTQQAEYHKDLELLADKSKVFISELASKVRS